MTKPKKCTRVHQPQYLSPPKSRLQRGCYSNSCVHLQGHNNIHFPKEINQDTEYLFFSITLLSRGAVATFQHIWISLPELLNSDSQISLPFVFLDFLKAKGIANPCVASVFHHFNQLYQFKYHSRCFS